MDEVFYGTWENNSTFITDDNVIIKVIAFRGEANKYILPVKGFMKLRDKKHVVDFVPAS